MIQTPYAAFGYVVLKNEVVAGETVNDALFKKGTLTIFNGSPFEDGKFGDFNNGCVWLYVDGVIRHTNLFDGTQKDRGRGYSNLVTPEDVGIFKIDVIDDIKMFCISHVCNESRTPRIPAVTYFKLLAGETQELPAGTKLFLADGQINVNGNALSGTRQIKVGDTARSATAISDCYGFIFP